MLRVANVQGFWGDSMDAPARTVRRQPNLDYMTLDYLAEVSMSILAVQRERDPNAGYARDFVDVVKSLIPAWQSGAKVKVISSAGGLNPNGCAQACIQALQEGGCTGMKVGVVSGDDIVSLVRSDFTENPTADYPNLEDGASIRTVLDRLVTANAYFGAAPIVEALRMGANIVVTGRVADPSLTVAPTVFHYGWDWTDYDCLAGAVVAGHLIECGAQITGGISTEWLDVSDPANMGYPIAEMHEDGSCVITKPEGTGGVVNERTVKEQLLYEIGDPAKYITPDATASLFSLEVREEAPNRVRVSGARGIAPPHTYKVSATYRDGFWAQGQITVFGRDAVAKANRCGAVIFERVRQAGYDLQRTSVECLGSGACAPGIVPEPRDGLETVLRISAADTRREAVERFTKEIAPLVTNGPQGVTGYAAGRPLVHPVFGYWPCLIDKSRVQPRVNIYDV
ncbi:MAG: DUF1446 domain-containing protein [Candidatus Hydrogenedentes bacterium]|nr:DUF1446 domain-containing protein [Candidatus Hydrogenedentota bacterium]